MGTERIKGMLLLPAVMLFLIAITPKSFAQQIFTKITDPSNAAVADTTSFSYTGAAFIDYDNDGYLDLFLPDNGRQYLYHNDGAGSFTRVTGINLDTDPGTYRGTGWADFDNDGDLDCFLTGSSGALYRNDGSTFTEMPTDLFDSSDLRGWSPCWADIDNDGSVEMTIVFPAGFVPGGNTPNKLLFSNGHPFYDFTPLDTGVIVTGLAPYTSGNFQDYDLDGDIDFFVGAGPANGNAAPDYLYRNMLMENGQVGYERILTSPLGTDLADGQVWNWIDYDNDGDLDAYRTNWGGGNPADRPNDLYRNDNGTHIAVTTGNIVTDVNISLSSVWGDFDNDGDIDCIVANANELNNHYDNNGDGTFSALTFSAAQGGGELNSGATAGDYDNDGDLDLFMVGSGTTIEGSRRALYRNDIIHTTNYLKLDLTGTVSNRSAIGAKVFVKATINGNPYWQHREISAQNTFLGHNALQVHFGLGDATTVDSIRIEWPSGIITDTTSVASNQTLDMVEPGLRIFADTLFSSNSLTVNFSSFTGLTVTSYNWDFDDGSLSSDPSPSHQFTNPGLYAVSLDASTPGGIYNSIADMVAIEADTIIIDQVENVVGGSQVELFASLHNYVPLQQLTVPISWDGPYNLSLVEVNNTGLRSEIGTVTLVNVDSFNKRLVAQIDFSPVNRLQPGNGAVLRFVFEVPSDVPTSEPNNIVLTSYNGYSLTADSPFGAFTPDYIDGYIYANCCQGLRGNVDGDVSDEVNISDLLYFVEYSFATPAGPEPGCFEEADVNADGNIDISDILYLVEYQFSNPPGPAPLSCP